MCCYPVPRDVEPARDPDPLVLCNMIKQPLKSYSARRVPYQAHMQPDGEHFGGLAAFPIEHVKSVTDEGVPLLRAADRTRVFAVIVGERVGYDKVRLTTDGLPKR